MFDGILRQYTEQKALKVDWDVLDELPTLRLMNSLVGVLPLATSDKQILLETIDTDRRLEIFSAILKAQSSSNRTVSH
jgi:Lon protease-like protein